MSAAAGLLYGVVRPASAPTSCVLGIVAVVAGLGAGPRTSSGNAERPAPLFPLEPAWSATLTSPPVSGPALDDEHAYVALKDGSLLAVGRESGEALWTVPVDVSLAPVVAGALVVVAGASRVTAVTAANGTAAWSVPLADPAVALASADGLVLVGTTRGSLVALSASDGGVRWRRQLAGRVAGALSVTGGSLAVVDEAGNVTALDLAGTVRWTRHLEGRLSPPAGTPDRVFVGSSTNAFFALRATDGATLWQWRLGGDISGVAVEGDRVYVVTLDNLIRAMDAGSGNQRWKASLTTRPGAPPLVLKGLAVVSGVAPRIDGFSRKNGTSAGSLVPDAELAGAPALAPALLPYRTALVAALLDGRLVAFRPERLMLRDGKAAPLTTLPGRLLAPEGRLPPATPR